MKIRLLRCQNWMTFYTILAQSKKFKNIVKTNRYKETNYKQQESGQLNTITKLFVRSL